MCVCVLQMGVGMYVLMFGLMYVITWHVGMYTLYVGMSVYLSIICTFS